MKSWARSSPEEMKGELQIRIYWPILTSKTFENFMNDEYAVIERIGNECRHRLCIKLLPINWKHQHVLKTVWTICRNKYFIPLTCNLKKIGHLCSKTSNIEIRFTLLSWVLNLINVVQLLFMPLKMLYSE